MKDLKLLLEGKHGKVYVTLQVEKELKKAFEGDFRTLSGLKARCQRFADNGQKHFTDDQFKSEGRHSKGTLDGKKIKVWALSFKQARLYGCLNNNENLFIAGSCDKKQQNKSRKIEKSRKNICAV